MNKSDQDIDGGGIRGYGSLLILQDLMNKVGEEEKRLQDIRSSFAPYKWKPLRSRRKLTNGEPERHPSNNLSPAALNHDVPPPTQNSSLFLPCHYFTYIAGTSTGG